MAFEMLGNAQASGEQVRCCGDELGVSFDSTAVAHGANQFPFAQGFAIVIPFRVLSCNVTERRKSVPGVRVGFS